jgi:hypothetical protein
MTLLWRGLGTTEARDAQTRDAQTRDTQTHDTQTPLGTDPATRAGRKAACSFRATPGLNYPQAYNSSVVV